MTSNNPPLGAELRDRREARGLNKTELAAQLGTTAVAVAAWERGDREPSDEHAAALLALFDGSERSE